MTVASPRGSGNPSPDRTWLAEVVAMTDRALGSRARFRRLLVLLAVLLPAIASIAMLVIALGIPALVLNLPFRR